MKVETLYACVAASLIAWCSRPDVTTCRARPRPPTTRQRRRVEVVRLTTELAEVRAEAIAGRLSPGLAASMETTAMARLATAEGHANNIGIPGALRDFVGPDAAQDWEDTTEIAARRDLIKIVMGDLRLHPQKANSKRQGKPRSIAERVEFRGFLAS